DDTSLHLVSKYSHPARALDSGCSLRIFVLELATVIHRPLYAQGVRRRMRTRGESSNTPRRLRLRAVEVGHRHLETQGDSPCSDASLRCVALKALGYAAVCNKHPDTDGRLRRCCPSSRHRPPISR